MKTHPALAVFWLKVADKHEDEAESIRRNFLQNAQRANQYKSWRV
jgi:hypothetical protein